MSTTQDTELLNIDLQLDHVNKVIKCSILDLDKIITSLKARLKAEEIYVAALATITKANESSSIVVEQNNFFGNYVTTFQTCAIQFQTSLEKTIQSRREYSQSLKVQIDLLVKVKESHEQRRKKVKTVLLEKNTAYVNFRTRDITKLQRTYVAKCNEYSQLQQQMVQDEETRHNEMIRLSLDEPKVSSDSSRDSVYTVDSSSLINQGSKKGVSSFIHQMRSQMTTVDPAKQNTRIAKLKKEVSDTDNEYRQGIRKLELLRKRQIETAKHAMRHVEAIMLDKYEVIKRVMLLLGKLEEDLLVNSVDSVKHVLEAVEIMDGKKDTERYLLEYEKLGFVKPKTIHYDNYQFGQCKEILFGSDLNEYCADHNRTIPLLVTKCIEAVEKQGGLEKEGIYRVSSRQSIIDALKIEFEKDEDLVDLTTKDPITIASVLKTYLRELKQPILNLSLQERMEYSKIKDDEERRMILETKLADLSKPQLNTLEAVIIHLAKVEKSSKVNKMNVNNLSVIFTPALFHDHNQAENPGEWTMDKIFEDLIYHHAIAFKNAEIIASMNSKNNALSSASILSSSNIEIPSSNNFQQNNQSMNMSFSVGNIVGRKASISKRFNVL